MAAGQRRVNRVEPEAKVEAAYGPQDPARELIIRSLDSRRFDSNLTVVAPPEVDGLPPAELQQLVVRLLEEKAEQKRLLPESRKEIA